MEYISNLLFWISNGLLIPDIILLLFFLIKGLINLICLFSEMNSRKNTFSEMAKIISEATLQNAPTLCLSIKESNNIYSMTVIDILNHSDSAPYCERALSDFEVEVGSRLNGARNLVKFGPMLGLMGTLIPMGPALVGLSTGDIVSMAYNMKVAFATTVVGIVIAIIGSIILQANRNYYARVYNQLEYLVNKLGCSTAKKL